MKIENLTVRNLRGITAVELDNLGNLIVVAGQNGSGKSCIFDAIRFLKSAYGGYQQNEWHQWMGEFQIRLSNDPSDFKTLFNDPSAEIFISATFSISEEERTYIHDNTDDLLNEAIWKNLYPDYYRWSPNRKASISSHRKDIEDDIRAKTSEYRERLAAELAAESVYAECVIPVNQSPRIEPSTLLEIIFSTFRPQYLGVIDYHGAQRHYGREFVQGINFNIDAHQDERRNSALYNYASKYNNVKSEMASSYIKEILSEQAGIPRASQSTLTNTLKELFETFFPDKRFLGPKPTADGGLEFPVQTSGGRCHDLDDLSAGEKEVLYGYLRIRNSAPRSSIILLDEPELHLNPRLIRELPKFYQKNLGQALGNQIWLVSHSDALLREVVGREGYNVFHMSPWSNVPIGQGQLKPLLVTEDLELALIDLVGDLAAYRPGGKVIIFEGGGDSDFDQRVVSSLFPELQNHANLVSGSNKARVRALHDVLNRASSRGQIPFSFFAIVDRDTDEHERRSESVNIFSWDVYHIENYLIEPSILKDVVRSLDIASDLNEDAVLDDLRVCAEETIPSLVRSELKNKAFRVLRDCIDLGTDPAKPDVARELSFAVARSQERIEKSIQNILSVEILSELEMGIRAKYEAYTSGDQWIKSMPGREILRRFAGKRASSVSYEVFRNLIISRMRESGFQPKGMKDVVEKVLNK